MTAQLHPRSTDTEHAVLAAILSAEDQVTARARYVRTATRLPAPLAAWFVDDKCRVVAHILEQIGQADGDLRLQSTASHLGGVSRDYLGQIVSGQPAVGVRPVNEAGSLLDWVGLDGLIQIASTLVVAEAAESNLTMLRNLRNRRDMIAAMRSAASDLQHAPPTFAPSTLIATVLPKLQALAEPDIADSGVGALEGWIANAASGAIQPIPTPFPILVKGTRLSSPGSLVVLAADPGSGKSVLAQQIILHAQANEVPCACLMLEESKTYWQRRALCMLSGNSNAGNSAWVRHHAIAAKELIDRHAADLDRFGRSLTTCPAAGITIPAIATWAEGAASAGAKLLLIDPLAVAQPTKPLNLVTESEATVAALKRTADRHGAVILLVTHPRKGTTNRRPGTEPLMDDLAGSAAIPRFSDAVLWLSALEEDDQSQAVMQPDGSVRQATVTRKIKVLKARNGNGERASVGLYFDGDRLRMDEVGLIVPQQKTKKVKDTAGTD